MCGRYTLIKENKAIEERFDAQFQIDELQKNYNAAPGTLLSVITNNKPDIIQQFQWGLVPNWAKNEQIAFKTINARVETIQEKPAFKNAFLSRRCLVPADGYYEWKKEGKQKIPYRITLSDESIFAFAGLWEVWKKNGITLYSFSIVTMPALTNIKHLHERMPIILTKENEKKWLHSEANQSLLDKLEHPKQKDINFYTVSPKVNSSSNNTSNLIKPFNHPKQGSLF